MNINQIKYVLTIAGCSSMREAATKLFVSQPALSLSVRELEEELGILIFERNNKGILLTDEGREFITYAKKAVGQYEILEDRYLAGDHGKERFSVSTQHFHFPIRVFTDVIKQNYPDRFLFSIHETKTKEVLEDVRTLKSEVGVVSFSGANKDVMKKLFREYQLEFVPLMQRGYTKRFPAAAGRQGSVSRDSSPRTARYSITVCAARNSGSAAIRSATRRDFSSRSAGDRLLRARTACSRTDPFSAYSVLCAGRESSGRDIRR